MVRLIAGIFGFYSLLAGTTYAMASQQNDIITYVNHLGFLDAEGRHTAGSSRLSTDEKQAILDFIQGPDGALDTEDDRQFSNLTELLSLEGITIPTISRLLLDATGGASGYTIPSPRKILQQLGVRSIGLDFTYGDTEYQIKKFNNYISFEMAILSVLDFLTIQESTLGAQLLQNPELTAACCGDPGSTILHILDARDNVLGLVTRDHLRSAPWPHQGRPNLKQHWVFFLQVPRLDNRTYLIFVPRNGEAIFDGVVPNLGISAADTNRG